MFPDEKHVLNLHPAPILWGFFLGKTNMTLQEFKAWLSGFCEGLGRAPNAEEWERIKEKIDKLKASVEFVEKVKQVPIQIPTWRYPYESPVPMLNPATRDEPYKVPMIWCQTDAGAIGKIGSASGPSGFASGEIKHGVN